MATIATTQPPSQSTPSAVESRFRQLESIWTAETGFLSSYTEIVQHPSFKQIIGLGKPVVPLMLKDLEERPRLWVWALPEITDANPVPADDAGNIAKMTEAWLRWGKANGYRW